MEIKRSTIYIQSTCSAIELFHSPQNSFKDSTDGNNSGWIIEYLSFVRPCPDTSFFFSYLTPHNSFIAVVFENLTFYVRHTPQLY